MRQSRTAMPACHQQIVKQYDGHAQGGQPANRQLARSAPLQQDEPEPARPQEAGETVSGVVALEEKSAHAGGEHEYG